MSSELQRDIDVMDSLVRQLNGWGLSSEESCAWQRIRAYIAAMEVERNASMTDAEGFFEHSPRDKEAHRLAKDIVNSHGAGHSRDVIIEALRMLLVAKGADPKRENALLDQIEELKRRLAVDPDALARVIAKSVYVSDDAVEDLKRGTKGYLFWLPVARAVIKTLEGSNEQPKAH